MSTHSVNYGRIVKTLSTEAVVSVDPRFGDPHAPPIVVSALWDTGANISAVAPKVVSALGLIPIDHNRACGVNGWYESPIFVIDLMLPNKIQIKGLQVSLGNMDAADMLIGMDVISLGDLLLTNDGTTRFTIRTPSEGNKPFEITEAS